MRSARIQLIATTIFALGFILAGSGWSAVLTSMLDGRPSWSVCGQEMCSCVKPSEFTPICPLCDGAVDQTTLLGSCDIASITEPEQSSQPTRRVPKNNDSMNALGSAGTSAAIALFVGTLISQSNASHDLNTQRDQIAATNIQTPRSRGLDLPTPPPRA